MICNKCGCKTDNDAKFCVRCGVDLKQEGAIIQESPQPYPQKPPLATESSNIIKAFIFALIGVIFAFATNFDYEWYILLLCLTFKAVGFTLSLIALIKTLAAPRPRRGLTLAAFILSIIGMTICGIAMVSGIFEFVHLII